MGVGLKATTHSRLPHEGRGLKLDRRILWGRYDLSSPARGTWVEIKAERADILLLQQKIGKRRMEEGTGNGRGMML